MNWKLGVTEPLWVHYSQQKWKRTWSGIDADEVVASLSDGVAICLRFTDYGRRTQREREKCRSYRDSSERTCLPCAVRGISLHVRKGYGCSQVMSLPSSPSFFFFFCISTVSLTWRTILTLLACVSERTPSAEELKAFKSSFTIVFLRYTCSPHRCNRYGINAFTFSCFSVS